jgi:hypothetical protein
MKKAQKKKEGAEKALRETETKIENLRKLDTLRAEKIVQESPSKRKEKVWYEKFRWFQSSDGFLVIGGKDAVSNEVLIKKYMENLDIVFHADISGAPFVIIKTEGREVPEQTIFEAAQFAGAYSKAWREMANRINVYWVRPVQVEKSPPIGQYLKKGSFIIRGAKNYLKSVPLRVAIGIREEKEGQIMVIGGPPDAICSQTNNYLEIVPGEQSSSDLAKRIRHLLSSNSIIGIQKKVSAIPIEQIQQFIPSGRANTVEKMPKPS